MHYLILLLYTIIYYNRESRLTISGGMWCQVITYFVIILITKVHQLIRHFQDKVRGRPMALCEVGTVLHYRVDQCFLSKTCCRLDEGIYGQSATILLTKTTAAQNEAALSYHRVRGQLVLWRLHIYFVHISTRQNL